MIRNILCLVSHPGHVDCESVDIHVVGRPPLALCVEIGDTPTASRLPLAPGVGEAPDHVDAGAAEMQDGTGHLPSASTGTVPGACDAAHG